LMKRAVWLFAQRDFRPGRPTAGNPFSRGRTRRVKSMSSIVR
jgi:hypothetical protein